MINLKTIRAKELCVFLAERCRADFDNGPYTGYRDLAVALGYTAGATSAVTTAAREAMRLGYIKAKQPRTHGLFFTDKGLAKYMPELAPPPLELTDEHTPEPEPAPTPAVPNDLSGFDSAYLVLELIERGFVVKRGDQ